MATILACQVIPTPPALKATQRVSETPKSPAPTFLPATLTPIPSPNPSSTEPEFVPPGELAPFPYRGQSPFAQVQAATWTPSTPDGTARLSLPFSLEQASNQRIVDGLTLRQRSQLAQRGFVIVHSQEPQFNELRNKVSLFNGQPYFLTTDAAYHALKITYDELLITLEREELYPRLYAVIQSTLEQVLAYLPLTAGSDLEAQTHLAAAYLGTALRLLDPQAQLDPELEAEVMPQVNQVLAARGLEDSILIPGFRDDFSLYRPAGGYLGDPVLEGFYRATAWLERVDFPPDEDSPRAGTYYLPLILTLALRQASTDYGPAAEEWARITDTLNFFIGLRAQGGPAEYSILMDQAFGRNLTILGLLEIPQREVFQSLLRDLPFPQIDPPLALSPTGQQNQTTWSFLSTRYRLDELILHELAPEQLENPDEARLLPGGLELMAVLGAPAALDAMRPSGAEFRSDPGQIAALRTLVESQTQSQWSAAARNLWLEAYRTQLTAQVPSDSSDLTLPFLNDAAWAYKDLNSALGSWAELQYDTSAFVQTPQAENGTVQPAAPPPPGFVEPNPGVFYLLARLAFSAAEGLRQRGLSGSTSASSTPNGLSQMVQDTFDLADRLQRLGDIAVKELNGEPLAASDYALIQAPLGPAEKRVMQSMQSSPQNEWLKLPPLPGVATFDYGGDRILQMGVGGVDRVYVLVPLGGEIVIAQGGVYSYYEFSLHRIRELDQTSWRGMLVNSPPEPPGWVPSQLYLDEGVAIDALAYRIGDLLRVKTGASPLSLRGSPGRDARIIQIAAPGEILEILTGPIEANGLLWWKVRVKRTGPEAIEGWIFENQEWIERAWNR